MKDNVVRYKCDVCGAMDFGEPTSNEPPKDWKFGTEVGDLCPDCARFWELTKEDFLTRMRK